MTKTPDRAATPSTTGAAPGRGAARPASPVMPLGEHELGATATGSYHEPHSVLGAHEYEGATTVRTLKPLAHEVSVLLPDGSTHAMEHEHDGIWVVSLPQAELPAHRLRVTWTEGAEPVELEEPYRFLPTIGELDLHLIREGRHEELWQALGSHVRVLRGESEGEDAVEGTSFAVWAPNARAVQVIGSFNGWDGRLHALRSLGSLWDLGGLRPRDRGRRDLQVPDPRRRRRLAGQGRSDGAIRRSTARHRVRDHHQQLRVDGR